MNASVIANSSKICVQGLRKRFFVGGQPVDALAGIDLDIRLGEFFCIVGPSGCGKTTFLRVLAGLETKTGGAIQVVRDPGGASGDGARPLNSMVFQEQSIY